MAYCAPSHPGWDYGFSWPAEAELSPAAPATCPACVQHSPVLPQVQGTGCIVSQCSLHISLQLTLRGLCHHSVFDREFHFSLDEAGKVKLLGFSRSHIAYNSSRGGCCVLCCGAVCSTGEWAMVSHVAEGAVGLVLHCTALLTPLQAGYSAALRAGLAVGRTNWRVVDPDCQVQCNYATNL